MDNSNSVLQNFIRKYLNPSASANASNNIKTMKALRNKINKTTKKGKIITLVDKNQVFYYLLKYGNIDNVNCEGKCKSVLYAIKDAIKKKNITGLKELIKDYDDLTKNAIGIIINFGKYDNNTNIQHFPVSLLNIEKSNSDFLKDWLIRLLLII